MAQIIQFNQWYESLCRPKCPTCKQIEKAKEDMMRALQELSELYEKPGHSREELLDRENQRAEREKVPPVC